MSFPQPDANLAVVRGQEYFRLNTPLSSPGDIYESEQGGYAFAIGPQSDISRVMIVYFDDVSGGPGTEMNFLEISPSRAFVGLIPARNDETYQPSKRKARILFFVSDLYDPDYRPEDIEVPGVILRITPQLDVLEYFAPTTSLTPQRDDKEFYFQDIPQAGTDLPTYIILPYYGRAYCFIELTNFSPDPIKMAIIGTNFAITNDFVLGPDPIHQETVLMAEVSLASGNQQIKILRSAVDGIFDVLVIRLTAANGDPGTPTPLKVVMSDTPQ